MTRANSLFAVPHQPAERVPSRQVTRGGGRGTEVEKGQFDREIERLTDGTSAE